MSVKPIVYYYMLHGHSYSNGSHKVTVSCLKTNPDADGVFVSPQNWQRTDAG